MKDKLLSLLFGAALLTLFIGVLLLPEKAVSVSERRTLRQFPVPTVKNVLSGEWGGKLDAWLPDQFPGREAFRRLALTFRKAGMRQSDYKGVYTTQGSLVKMLYPLNETAVTQLGARIDRLNTAYFPDSSRYCGLIPDKGAFYGPESGHLSLDFDRMERLLAETCQTAEYIPIGACLTGEDYYATDIHWRQERILPVAERLSAGMGTVIDGPQAYTAHGLYPFYGSYAARAARVEPETLRYLTSAVTEAATVENRQKPGVDAVYEPSALAGMDGYDVFLSGASPLITVKNTAPSEAAKGKTLILFRDSFGSAIAPLLLSGYERVVLVDLRYLAETALADNLQLDDPANTDVLFLFGAETANTTGILR